LWNFEILELGDREIFLERLTLNATILTSFWRKLIFKFKQISQSPNSKISKLITALFLNLRAFAGKRKPPEESGGLKV
jgi:hypothetical protein